MKPTFTVFLFLIPLLLLIGIDCHAQVTYTTSGTCSPTQANYFTTASCWIKSGTCNTPTVPPFTGTINCNVIININHEVNLNSLTLGDFITIRINNSGKLKITNDIIKSAETTASIVVNGGEIEVNRNLIVNAGKNNTKTVLNIDIRNGGKFNINGGLLDIGNDATMNITGDGANTSSLFVKSFEFGQRSTLNIKDGGGLIVEGITDFTGNNSSINVEGNFRTGGVLIRGGAGNQLNAFDGAKIIIENDLDVRGNSEIFFGGNSETDIGGNIRVEGGSKVNADDSSKVYVCGTYPDPNTTNSTNEIDSGKFFPSCRLLPVDFLDLEVKYMEDSKSTTFQWSTVKEWENSHFEIERAIDTIDDFQKIDEVEGMGWKDTVTEYEYIDSQLPLGKATLYYRLKQVDFDGTATYSKTLAVITPGLQFTQGVWRAHPNPFASNAMQVSLLDTYLYEGEELTFRLIQPTSSSSDVTVSSVDKLNEKLQGQLGAMGKGIIILEIRWGTHIEHLKLLKR